MCLWRFDGKKPSREKKNNFCGKLVSLDYRPLHIIVTLINQAEILCTFKVSVRELLKVFREKCVQKKCAEINQIRSFEGLDMPPTAMGPS